nr:translation initiation factor IF-2-like [Gorilla gorilla gorilla]
MPDKKTQAVLPQPPWDFIRPRAISRFASAAILEVRSPRSAIKQESASERQARPGLPFPRYPNTRLTFALVPMATALRGVSAGAGEPGGSAKEGGARPGRLAPSPARPPRAGGPGGCTAGKRHTAEGPSGGHARRAPARPGRGRGRAGERAGRGRPVPGPAPARRPPKLRHTPRRGHAAAAAILCGRHLPARRARDSPFSSNKDINPTLLARDWDEVRRDVNPSPSPRRRRRSAARSGRARCRRRAAGRGCPSDVRGPHPSAPELGDLARRDGAVSRGRPGSAPSPPASGPRGPGGGKHRAGGAGPPPLHRTHLWNVLALTEQRRRRAQATLGPSVRPPRQASLPIGWRSATARSSLVRLRRQSHLSAPLLLPEAPLAASARLQPRPRFLPFPSPRLSQRSSRRSPWVSRDPEWPWWPGRGTGGRALLVWALREDGGWSPPSPGLGQAAASWRLPGRRSHRPRNCFRGRVFAAATFGERNPTAFSPQRALISLSRPPGTPVSGPRGMSCFSTLSPRPGSFIPGTSSVSDSGWIGRWRNESVTRQ